MSIYVVEIDGRALAAFHAETDIAADELADSDWFRSDLMVLEYEGRPLWDGASDIHVREANDEERGEWDSSRARAILDGELDGGEKDWLQFLVPAVDPTEEDDDGR